MMESIDKFGKWIAQSGNIVFFGGAGVSTESGIPDFRGAGGLYSREYDYPPEVVLSHDFFFSHTEEFFKFYREKMLVTGVKPNMAHVRLAQWERAGKIRAVVTQNIDGLHQAAGSRNVFELHGSVLRNHCVSCGAFYPPDELPGGGVPRCRCGGVIKPGVVLYQEPLDRQVLEGAAEAIAAAEMLIVGGTSLSVYPAAGLIDLYRGDRLVLINRSETARDHKANLILRGSIGETLGRI